MSSATSNEGPSTQIIDFGYGYPDASLLPVKEIIEATQQALVSDSSWLQYGLENGNMKAREALADFLANLYQTEDVVDPDSLCFTTGVSDGIRVTCRALQRMHSSVPPPLCWLEDPTYFSIPSIFRQVGYELRLAPTNPISGLDVAALKAKLQAAREADPERLMVVYTIPTHHNPLGVSLHEDHRRQLIELCENYNTYLIADEVYHGLTFVDADPKPKPMATGTQKSALIVSTSAFSKILCPGIRCGWIQTTNRELMSHILQDGVFGSAGCCSQMASGIVAQMIRSGSLATYLRSLQIEYAHRCRHLCRLLQEASGPGHRFEFQVPEGGFFLWVRIAGIDFPLDEAFQRYCQTEHRVDFKMGMACSARITGQDEGIQFLGCMRLCFACFNTEVLTQGVERLCHALEAYPRLVLREPFLLQTNNDEWLNEQQTATRKDNQS